MANFYIIPTPIGNLEDISLRALRSLEEVDIILCEDTRVTQKLLNYFSEQENPSNHQWKLKGKELISYHEHNEKQRCQEILKQLNAGKNIALVSDAGTPLISDPGMLVIKAIHELNSTTSSKDAEHQIIPLPGACAATTALSASNLDSERFYFEGFLPHSGQHRRRVLKKIKERLGENQETLVFYESPHRIIKTLADIKTILGDVDVFLARELTKKFEELYNGKVEEVSGKLKEQFNLDKKDSKIQGEFVLITSSQ